MPRKTSNHLIRDAAATAWAYVPVSDRAAWLRAWRATARRVAWGTLKGKLRRHCDGLRLREDNRPLLETHEY